MNVTVTRKEQVLNVPKTILCTKNNIPSLPTKSFEGERLETALIYQESTPTLYVGVGLEEELNSLDWKEIGAKISKTWKAEKIYSFAVVPNGITETDSYFRNLTQGLILGLYEFHYKTETKEEEAWNVQLISQESNGDSLIAEGVTLSEAVTFARNMVNRPANKLRPPDFAKEIQAFLEPVGVECQVIAGEELEKIGMNGLFSIGNSSNYPPQLVIMRYNTAPKNKKTALVGKGVTFDTGGYSLKPAAHMMDMQGDMGGAAAVVGALYSLAKNQVSTNVVGVVGLCENLLSNTSLLPGDIYTSFNGQTVEVLNTDAEGRIVLADAVSYAVREEKADEVVDLATLTGAQVSTFGFGVAAIVGNDDMLAERVQQASTHSGERYWILPTYPEFHKMIESRMADVKNLGGPEGGTITGGLFIGRFVDGKPWAHLDIAGPSWINKPLWEHQSLGATGTGVDTMYYLCKGE